MEVLGDQLIHASEQVRRLRGDGESVQLLYWLERMDVLLDALSARMHGVDQPV